MAAAIVHTYVALGVTGIQNVSVTQIGTGNAIVVCVGLESGGPSYTVSDSVNGTYVERVTQGGFTGFDDAAIYDFRNSGNGVTTVTITPDSGGGYDYVVLEVSGLDNGGTVVTDTYANGDTTDCILTDSGWTGSGFAVGIAVLGTSRLGTAGSGWTRYLWSSTNGTYCQAKVGGFSNDQGPFTFNVSPAAAYTAAAFYPEATGGPRLDVYVSDVMVTRTFT